MIHAPPQYIFALCPLHRLTIFSVPPSPSFVPLQGNFGVVGVRNGRVKKLFGFTVLQESYNGLAALCQTGEVPFW